RIIASGLFLLPVFISAQSVTLSPDTALTSPSSACLACTGTTWNNEGNVSLPDGLSASTTLMQNGSCFQSSCYCSRFLYANSFGFSIPLNASIDSILVDVLRYASIAGAIKDSVIQLDKSGTLVGNNLYSSAFWPATGASTTYGHSDPLWGTAPGFWTPADLNDPASGVSIKVTNLSSGQAAAYVDHIQMTVFYSTAAGTFSASSSPSRLFISSGGTDEIIAITGDGKQHYSVSLMDATGKLILQQDLGIPGPGRNEFSIHLPGLVPGIYFWNLQGDTENETFKTIISPQVR
ncbi:MAG TPA: T9SS type A sorting domain-containing protein, partial [Bacteroidia bacterium]|nr:T9SS type A sorting domain-containing protein [Bacteroidia bacterium]